MTPSIIDRHVSVVCGCCLSFQSQQPLPKMHPLPVATNSTPPDGDKPLPFDCSNPAAINYYFLRHLLESNVTRRTKSCVLYMNETPLDTVNLLVLLMPLSASFAFPPPGNASSSSFWCCCGMLIPCHQAIERNGAVFFVTAMRDPSAAEQRYLCLVS